MCIHTHTHTTTHTYTYTYTYTYTHTHTHTKQSNPSNQIITEYNTKSKKERRIKKNKKKKIDVNKMEEGTNKEEKRREHDYDGKSHVITFHSWAKKILSNESSIEYPRFLQ